MFYLSKKSLVVALGVMTAAAVVICTSAQTTGRSVHALRKPSSEARVLHGKASGLFEVNLKRVPSLGPSGSMDFEIEATVTALTDVRDVQYSWTLPGDVSAHSAIDGSIGTMQKHEKRTLRFQASSATSENRQIHFHVFRMINGEAMGTVSQYNTTDQEVLRAKLEWKAQTLDSNSAMSAKPRVKIYQ